MSSDKPGVKILLQVSDACRKGMRTAETTTLVTVAIACSVCRACWGHYWTARQIEDFGFVIAEICCLLRPLAGCQARVAVRLVSRTFPLAACCTTTFCSCMQMKTHMRQWHVLVSECIPQAQGQVVRHTAIDLFTDVDYGKMAQEMLYDWRSAVRPDLLTQLGRKGRHNRVLYMVRIGSC